MRRGVLSGIFMALAACSRFGSDPSDPDREERPDAGTALEGGASSSDGAPSSDAEEPNEHLFKGGGVEGLEPGTNCGTGWNGFQGEDKPSESEHHEGLSSCRVCKDAGYPLFTLNSPRFESARKGDRIRIRMWVKTSEPAPRSAKIFGRVWSSAPVREVHKASSAGLFVPPGTWQLMSYDYEVTAEPTGYVDAFLELESDVNAGNVCVFVDDWEMWKVN